MLCSYALRRSNLYVSVMRRPALTGWKIACFNFRPVAKMKFICFDMPIYRHVLCYVRTA